MGSLKKRRNEKSPDVPSEGASGLSRAVPPAPLFSTASGLRLFSTHAWFPFELLVSS
jgi:hypothetical protein